MIFDGTIVSGVAQRSDIFYHKRKLSGEDLKNS